MNMNEYIEDRQASCFLAVGRLFLRLSCDVLLSITTQLSITKHNRFCEHQHIYTVGHKKTCHFILDYNFGVS